MTNRHSNTRSVRRSESPYVCRIANIDDSIGYRSNKEVCWECYLYICLSEVFDDNVILLSMHEYETFIHDGRHQSPVTRHKKEMTIASCIFLLFLFCFKLLRLSPHHARTKSFCLSFASRAPLITVFHWSIPTRLLCTPYSNAVLGLLYMYWGLGYLVPVLLQIPITRYDSLDNNPSVQFCCRNEWLALRAIRSQLSIHCIGLIQIEQVIQQNYDVLQGFRRGTVCSEGRMTKLSAVKSIHPAFMHSTL